MHRRESIQNLLHKIAIGKQVRVVGWVQNRRISKQVIFIMLQDGSSFSPLQVVIDRQLVTEATLKNLTVGCSVVVEGSVVASPGAEQAREVAGSKLEVLGSSPADYPLQPKRHSLEFLRTIQHLRFRTRTFHAVFRVRHAISYAIHAFLHARGFYWLHTPIITSVDAEGSGEVFGVTDGIKVKGDQKPFFGKRVSLTVSGQLAGEAGAMGLGKIYTFGPTFRAENSNTRRHLAEFWMVEPEMVFYDLQDTMALAEDLMKHVVNHVLQHCGEEMAFLEKRPWHKPTKEAKQAKLGLRAMLKHFVQKPFARMTYTEAIELLQKAYEKEPSLFTKPIHWGMDLQIEQERYLTNHLRGAVLVTDYPIDLKAFYMRKNADKKTVAAMDLLLPGVGEVIGGSQREERLDLLMAAMDRVGIDSHAMDWYLDTRRFGSVPHSGFGVGLERLVLFITGMENARDVIPFPRTPGQAMH